MSQLGETDVGQLLRVTDELLCPTRVGYSRVMPESVALHMSHKSPACYFCTPVTQVDVHVTKSSFPLFSIMLFAGVWVVFC